MRKTTTYFVLVFLFFKVVIRPLVGGLMMETPPRTLSAILTHFSMSRSAFNNAPMSLIDVAKKRSRRKWMATPTKQPLFNVFRWTLSEYGHRVVEPQHMLFGREPDALVHPPA